ncbi:MAG: hypothetical protein ACXWUN_05810 [Allosphingosinicella sp.]
MIVKLFAFVLLAAAGQAPDPAEPAATPAHAEDHGNGQEPEEAAEAAAGAAEAAAEAVEAAAEEAAQAAEVAAEAAEPDDGDSGIVCRRVTYFNDFGRQRSRRSCGPR